MNSDKDSNKEGEPYDDPYDDRWDYLYDDIDEQKHIDKIKKSERKEGNKSNQQDW